jgi:hypothetical protein
MTSDDPDAMTVPLPARQRSIALLEDLLRHGLGHGGPPSECVELVTSVRLVILTPARLVHGRVTTVLLLRLLSRWPAEEAMDTSTSLTSPERYNKQSRYGKEDLPDDQLANTLKDRSRRGTRSSGGIRMLFSAGLTGANRAGPAGCRWSA